MTPVLNEVVGTLARISDGTPTLCAARCVNQRHAHAGQCSACAAACPASAIALTPVPAIDSSACLACGACSAACPSDALEGVRSLVEMWRKARETLDAVGAVALVCRAVGKGSFAAARIPCACALPPEFYVALAMADVEQVVIHTAVCNACPAGPALAQAQRAVEDAQRLLAHVGRAVAIAWTTDAPPLQPAKQAGITRRGLFSAVLNPAALRDQPAQDYIDDLTAAGIGPRRALLLDALNRDEISAAAPPTYEGHWGSVTADQTACIGCQMCAQFCPTEALATTEDAAGAVTLWLDTARCTACGLCVRACFRHALAFEESVRLAALAVSEYRPIWRGRPPANPLRSRQAFKAAK